ncbi:hypothetical protein CEXT_181581, partial [Caerostris extrusa]
MPLRILPTITSTPTSLTAFTQPTNTLYMA